jgi:hypothetical protein
LSSLNQILHYAIMLYLFYTKILDYVIEFLMFFDNLFSFIQWNLNQNSWCHLLCVTYLRKLELKSEVIVNEIRVIFHTKYQLV